MGNAVISRISLLPINLPTRQARLADASDDSLVGSVMDLACLVGWY